MDATATIAEIEIEIETEKETTAETAMVETTPIATTARTGKTDIETVTEIDPLVTANPKQRKKWQHLQCRQCHNKK